MAFRGKSRNKEPVLGSTGTSSQEERHLTLGGLSSCPFYKFIRIERLEFFSYPFGKKRYTGKALTQPAHGASDSGNEEFAIHTLFLTERMKPVLSSLDEF